MPCDADNSDVIYKGAERSIAYAVCADGSRPAKEFLATLDTQMKMKLRALFVRLGDHGKISNREKFKLLEEKIFEFKCNQVRIACFQVGTTWFLTSGITKKRSEWRPEEVAKAKRIRAEHLERKQKQTHGEK